jgi:hypothetical protein
MAFKVVNQDKNGAEIELKGTIFRFAGNPGQEFETREEAEKAIQKAKPFHPARFFKATKIKEI